MDFLIGFGFSIPLAFYTIIVWMLARKLPKEAILASMMFMILGDTLLVAIYFYPLQETVSSVQEFKFGISAAFGMSALGRAIYFVTKGDTLLK